MTINVAQAMDFDRQVKYLEALHGVKLLPYQLKLLKLMSDPTKKRIIMFNPINKMKNYIANMAARAVGKVAGTSSMVHNKEPKDFTPKVTGSVRLNSHHNSKSARKSRQKRGY